MTRKICLLFILTIYFFAGCKKEEGVGGDASINGKVFRKHYNSTFSTLINQSYYPDTYVYIIYGNSINYGKRIKTNYKGEFEFNYLYKGNYKIYTYSIDSAAIVNGIKYPSDSAVIADVSISNRKAKIDLKDIVVFE